MSICLSACLSIPPYNLSACLSIPPYNNRLFMAPHLIRAQSAYKESPECLQRCNRILISSHTHAHTCTCVYTRVHTHTHTHALLVIGWWNEKKENNRSVCRREEMGFRCMYLCMQARMCKRIHVQAYGYQWKCIRLERYGKKQRFSR